MTLRDVKQAIQHELVSGPVTDWRAAPLSRLLKAVHDIADRIEGDEPIAQDARAWIARLLQEEIKIFGPLHALMHDGTITEIMVNGPGDVFVERNGVQQRSEIAFADEAQLRRTIEGILALQDGARLDGQHPFADIAGPDGSRINLAIPPAVFGGQHLTIRKFHGGIHSLADLQAQGSLDARMAEFLVAAVVSKHNLLFIGGAGSGKTTLLENLAHEIDDGERLIIIEDTLELRFDQPNVVRLLTRDANIEGRGAITIRDLVRNALRMNPDRILLGEIRGGEALEYLQALSSGHRGSMAILHASSPEEALARLENLTRYSGIEIPTATIRKQIGYGLDLMVQVEQMADGTRKVRRIVEVRQNKDDTIDLIDLFSYEPPSLADGEVHGRFVPHGNVPAFHHHFARYGQTLSPLLYEPTHRTLTDVMHEA